MTETIGLDKLRDAAKELAYNVEERERYITAFMQIKDEYKISNSDAREILETALRDRGLADRTIMRSLPDELKDKNKQIAGRLSSVAKLATQIAGFSQNPEKIITSPEPREFEQQEKDFENFAAKTYQTDDPRSEAIIQDEVKASMQHSEDKYGGTVTEEEIDELKAKIKKLEETNKELTKDDLAVADLKSEINRLKESHKDKEYVKLEQKLTELEETNQRLLNENKQYSEAVLKHGFETATNVKTDPQQIKNYEEMITSLEVMLKQKSAEIEELNQKLESFEHIDNITAENQPIKLDVKPFIGVIFANRANIVTLVHDGKKVLNIQGGGR